MHRTLLRSLALALAAVLALAAAYGFWEPAPTPGPPARVFAGNAIWARYQWFSGVPGPFHRTASPYRPGRAPLPAREIDAFADRLRENRLRNVFIFTGSLDPEGRYPLWPLEDAHAPFPPAATFARLRARAPGLRILAWVGGVHAGFKRGQMNLQRPAVRENAARLCERLVREAGFDGVHLNIEPTRNDDDEYIALLAAVRHAIPPGAILSVAGARSILPEVPSFRPFGNHLWDLAYTARVAARVDQIAFMTYDTFMPFPKLHRVYIRSQTRALVRAARMGNPRAEVLLGVPSYDEHNISHVRHVETLGNTLRGIRAGLGDMKEGTTPFVGVAIYASWTTDEEEWRAYRALWLGDRAAVAAGPGGEKGARPGYDP